MALSEKLEKIRSPRLQNQHDTAVVLKAVEDTLREQTCDFTPTAYFAALLAILGQAVSAHIGIINKDLATSVIYLLDLTTGEVPASILRSKFSQILTNLAPTLTAEGVDAPLIKSSIGCLESLLLAQDAAAWALSQTQIGPRRAIAGLLTFAVDTRPKVRKRAQDAVTHILENPPPSPALDHPAADMCAETALVSLTNVVTPAASKNKKSKVSWDGEKHNPEMMHALQLVKVVASASRGWPSKKIEALCGLLMDISRSSNEYLTMTVFEIFELIFENISDEISSSKLARLLEVIQDLRPPSNDTQLVPPWIAVVSRGYDVSAQVEPNETFHKLPGLIQMISSFFTSSSHNIRVSASECLISFLANCIPKSVILEPSIYENKILEQLTRNVSDLLSVKYQAAWMEIFSVFSSLFTALKWRANGVADDIVKNIGSLRGNDSFNGKKEADAVLGKAIGAVGPEAVLSIIPLNIVKPAAGDAGRAWLLPILRDHISITRLTHFRAEFVPLSEVLYQKVMDHGGKEKTIGIKIFETLVQQIWALFPGYCDLPTDLTEAFDQGFAELLSNLLYKQTELRGTICKALQNLVETNQQVLSSELLEEELRFEWRITKEQARNNLQYLSGFTGNLLAVLFNVYGQTLPHHRGYILLCINAYLSITPEKELQDTCSRVCSMLESSLPVATPSNAPPTKAPSSSSIVMPPQSHTLLDLLVTLSSHLPSSSFPALFQLATRIVPLSSDPQLQKKAYKLIPKLATSDAGIIALKARSSDLQALLLETAISATPPCRHDRLVALATLVQHVPPTDLHFIPSILSEVVIATKESNEKARLAAFDTLVLMAERMSQPGGIITQSKIPHMPANAPTTSASVEEFFTMLAAGLGGDSPHMVSASITGLTRVLYDYHARLPNTVSEELVGAMSLFLENPNREIVRSVLGFMKVTIISLPVEIVGTRLETLIPGLMRWSREHKSHFRMKVKHILERAMRRFGADVIEKICPEQDKSLVKNIRKSRERNRRKRKEGAGAGAGEGRERGGSEDEYDGSGPHATSNKNPNFTNAFDDEIYGSDDSEPDSSANLSDDDDAMTRNLSQAQRRLQRQQGHHAKDQQKARNAKYPRAGTYIHEEAEGDPLDLLSTSALGQISSSAANTSRKALPKKHKGKVNIDGKLVIGMDDEDNTTDSKNNNVDAMVIDHESKKGEGNKRDGGDNDDQTGGIDAYVEAIKGRDSVQRGRGGRLKFDNTRKRGGRFNEEKMDVDDDGKDFKQVKAKAKEKQREGDRVNGLKIHYVGRSKEVHGGGGGGVRAGRVGKSRGGFSPGSKKGRRR